MLAAVTHKPTCVLAAVMMAPVPRA